MTLKASQVIVDKLRTKHNVTIAEVKQCFNNREGGFVIDNRAQHRTNPVTQTFIAETDSGRELKVCFMVIDGDIHIKTAFPPSAAAKQWYEDNQ